MPDDPTQNPPAPPAPAPPASETPPKWEDVYAKMSPTEKAAHDAHTAGLKSALDKERESASSAAAALKALEAEKAAAAQKQLEAQGEFKTLAEQRGADLAAAQAKLDEATKAIEANAAAVKERDALLQKALDAQKKSLKIAKPIEDLLATMPPMKQIEWLEAHGADLAKAGPGLPPSPGSSGNGKTDVKEILKHSPRTF